MKFNEDTRVKIPAILHLARLGYGYLPLKSIEWNRISLHAVKFTSKDKITNSAHHPISSPTFAKSSQLPSKLPTMSYVPLTSYQSIQQKFKINNPLSLHYRTEVPSEKELIAERKHCVKEQKLKGRDSQTVQNPQSYAWLLKNKTTTLTSNR